MPHILVLKAARRGVFVLAFFAVMLTAAPLRSQDAPPVAKGGGADDALPRLLATLDAEPLALIACRDARELPEKFAATTLSKMLNDPQYERGAQFIDGRIAAMLGANLRAIWPEFSKSISGPIALAVLPAKPGALDAHNPPLRVVFLVQVNEAEVGLAVKQQWPAIAPMADAAMKAVFQTNGASVVGAEASGLVLLPAELKTVATGELPQAAQFPAWVTKAAWPAGDVLVRAQPIHLCGAARDKEGKIGSHVPGEAPSILEVIDGSGIDAFAWCVAFAGELVSERLVVDLAEDDSAFKKFAGAIRETPASWDGLMGATPGDVDAAILFQSEPAKLGKDLPYVFQAVERYLRGKRWTKAAGLKSESLDPARFKFLSDRMQGSFAIVAKPTITGDMRLTVTTSIKGGEVEKFREELLKGLEATGAPFETLTGARKIGGALPLGAAFHGRGQFTTPVIGMSAGWAWLCSSAISYNELTDAFKTGKTMAAREKRRVALAPAAPVTGANAPKPVVPPPPAPDPVLGPNDWSADDAVRVEVNLDHVLKIGYSAWLLSSADGPSIFGQKVPSELLPPPQVFQRNVGKLRASANRTANRVECRSTCVFPGITVLMLGALQDASESLIVGRKLATGELVAAPPVGPAAGSTKDKVPPPPGLEPGEKPDPEPTAPVAPPPATAFPAPLLGKWVRTDNKKELLTISEKTLTWIRPFEGEETIQLSAIAIKDGIVTFPTTEMPTIDPKTKKGPKRAISVAVARLDEGIQITITTPNSEAAGAGTEPAASAQPRTVKFKKK